ncbi:SDR family NAD(P)-dependent oxidoreductase [Oscillospiraceae bacterium MB08-C2-2]|nr:SDR family NAD(P)-dependent oxidoreductase [Oscillospiraceae bacterium MB08-C2-2]
MLDQLLQDKVSLVTGAGRGIGRSIAVTLAKAGSDIIVFDVNEADAKEVQAEIIASGRRCEILVGDIRNPQVCEQARTLAEQAFGRIDLLVNNAGIMDRKGTLDMALEDWQRVIDINLNGLLYMSRALLPLMVKQNSGNIVNITSANGKTPHPNAAPSYGATKAAVTYLTKHFALEFANHNIRVNAVQCGPIESLMTQQWSEEYRKAALSKIPLGRLGLPEDVANAVVYLASDLSAFVTGVSLNLSGGKLME